MGAKLRLPLVAFLFVAVAVQVTRVEAQTDAPAQSATASLVSDHLRCIAYYAIMGDCLARFSQEYETRYFNVAANLLTRARELGASNGQTPKAQEATVRTLFAVLERSVGNRCENVRKLTDLQPLHDQYSGFCKAVGNLLPQESASLDPDFDSTGEHAVIVREASVQGDTIRSPDPQPVGTSPPGWMIQLGAFVDEAEAEQRLRSAQDMAQTLLGDADGFTERVIRGSKDLYRVRVGGLDKDKAKSACQYLKRKEIECIVLKQ